VSIGPDTLKLLQQAHQMGASDLLLCAGSPPSIYLNARLRPLTQESLSAPQARHLVDQMLPEEQRARLDEQRDADFSLGHASFGRCRVNVHFQRSTLAAAIRFVSDRIPELAKLSLPPTVAEFARFPRGMVLITGGTGSGKSTTLAAILNEINRSAATHIITLEDPIEYAFRNDRSVIEQREIGFDSPSFAQALRYIVRQKPDVIMIGEMRDLETIRAALTAAETGHLVLASLHTISAAQTVERIIDVFPPNQQGQVRVQLAGALRAIACQVLFADDQQAGLVPAVELMISTPAVSRAIRDGETHLLPNMIETGSSLGMQSLDHAIAQLVVAGRISREDGLSKANDPDRLVRALERRQSEAVGATSVPAKPWE
jgi:twitching motility protein PilT